MKFNFAFDLDRDVEREFSEANGAPGVQANLGAEDLDYEIREAIDYGGLVIETRRGVDHS